MLRNGFLGLAVALLVAAAARCDDDALKQALALETSIQKAVEAAEPSVACILVSRSEEYDKLGEQFNPGRTREPGKLGGFRPPQDNRFAPQRGRLDRDRLARLNLEVPDTLPDSYGSGVVIDSRGLILTNRHVIQDATKIYVRLPGEKSAGSYANIRAADSLSDLAVLELIDPPPGLKALRMGDADNLKKGQFVLSIANPFAAGFKDGSPSVSWGLLSNIRRRLPGEPNDGERRRPRLHFYKVLLQTDIRMPLGCSGGALLDLRGNWIGLTTSISGVAGGESAGGYAIPLDKRMKGIIGKLREGQEVEYGFLGILQTSQGRWVPTPNGPASKAGMMDNDRIISIDGHPVEEQDDLLLNIGASLAGTEVQIVVASNFGPRRELRARLAKANWPTDNPTIAANRPKPVYGLRVDYTSVDYKPSGRVSDPGIPPGVVVREVVEGSPAAKAELHVLTDIILAVNGKYVNTPQEFYDAAKKANGAIELTIKDNPRKVKLP